MRTLAGKAKKSDGLEQLDLLGNCIVALRFGELLVERGGVLRFVLGRLDRGHSSPLARSCMEV
jgi:hypothetical protein